MTSVESEFEYNGCRFIVREGTNDRDIVRSVYEEYTLPDESEYEPGSVSCDIGAHIGSYGIFAMKRWKDLRVIFVEPIPENLDLLRRNIYLNDMADRAIVINGAVGTGDYLNIFYTNPNTESGRIHHWIGNSSGNVADPSDQSVAVSVYELKNLLFFATSLKGGCAHKIWTIKLDCEGGEVGFLDQATDQQLNQVGFLIGEYHSSGVKPLIERMTKAGFAHIDLHRPEALFCFKNPKPFAELG